jgi:serine/threonine protein kinase
MTDDPDSGSPPPTGVPSLIATESTIQVQERRFVSPSPGELITSEATSNTYRIGNLIGEGNFGYVYDCIDTWENQLAVKILKPHGSYEQIRNNAVLEYQKLRRNWPGIPIIDAKVRVWVARSDVHDRLNQCE